MPPHDTRSQRFVKNRAGQLIPIGPDAPRTPDGVLDGSVRPQPIGGHRAHRQPIIHVPHNQCEHETMRGNVGRRCRLRGEWTVEGRKVCARHRDMMRSP